MAMADEAAEQTQPSSEFAEDGVSNWPAVQYDVSPYRAYHFFQQFRTNESNPNNFLKGVKWSPDGSCFLTCNEDNTLRVFSLPYNDIGGPDAPRCMPDSDSYGPNFVVNEGESAYDYCCLVFQIQIHVYSQHLHGTILFIFGMLILDRYAAHIAPMMPWMRLLQPSQLASTLVETRYLLDTIKIRIFKVHRPGRDFEQHSTVLGNKEGQSGIISSIAFSPTCSGMLAAGSCNQTTAIYREDNMELLYVLHGQEGGVTQVQFSKDGNYLYSGGRKDPYILCWDIRKTVDIVYKLYRSSEGTNQRIQFDIEPLGRYLGTGGQDGLVHIYDLQTGEWVSSFRAALDTVNGFGFHPFLPMAATSSGHRRYIGLDDSEEDNSLSGDENCVSIWSFYSSASDDAVEGVADVSN